MSLFSTSKKNKLIAVFDITSSSIGGILFFHYPDKLPEIITTSRFSTDFFPELNFSKIQRSLHKTFEKTVGGLKKKMPDGRKKPDEVFIIFSSPYYISQTKIVRLKKEHPFEITDNFLKKITADEMVSFKKEWEEKNKAKNEGGVEIIEYEEMKTNLNGYPVKQPIGKHSLSIELFLYMSLGIKPISDKLKECISHSFGEMPVHFQTFPFTAFTALKTIMDISNGLLLIDVGGEITDLILIKNGILEETISFPLGENFLVRRIASVFRFSLEESFSLLRQCIRGDLHADTNEKVKKIIEDAAAKWCQFFKDSTKESPEFSLPPQNLLFIGGKGALIFKDLALCTKEQPFTSQFLMAEALKNRFVFKKGFTEDKDILLMLSTLFVNKLLNY